MKKIQKIKDLELENVTGGIDEAAIIRKFDDHGWFHGDGCTGRIKQEGFWLFSTSRCTNCHEEHKFLNQFNHYYSIQQYLGCERYLITYDDGSQIETTQRPPELDYPWNHN